MSLSSWQKTQLQSLTILQTDVIIPRVMSVQTYMTIGLQSKTEQRFTLPAKVHFHLGGSCAGSFQMLFKGQLH